MDSVRLRLGGALMLSSCFFFAACGGGGGDGGASSDDAAPSQPDAGLADAAVNADAGEAGDASPGEDASAVMSITEIVPAAASRSVDTELTVLGYNLEDGAELLLTNCDDASIEFDLSASVAVAGDGRSLSALLEADGTRAQGLYTVRVTNPDQQSDELACAFRVLAQEPPSVTEVIADQAYRGVSGDGINSDSVVTISGEGFRSTPNVRFLKTDGTASYDALFVGFNSETQLTAVVPAETLAMQAGEYHVFAVNPSLLSAQWLVPDGNGGTVPGIFTITETPPPDILDVSPSRVDGNNCTSTTMVISGSGFDADASDGATSTAWYMTEGTSSCTGGMLDQSGNQLCPLTTSVVDGTTIEALFPTCPNQGAYPVRVINPDGQFDTFFNVEIRPSNDGHLSTDPFETSPMTLETPRFKHASSFGFDVFGNAFIYVTGGEDATGLVLDSTELTQLDVFGNLSPFATSMQYLGPDTPRVVNTLTTPRQGATMARLGRTLYLVGGADTSTDVLGTVTAQQTMERARILGYFEMPAVQQPKALGGGGLPVGSWYYRVSAVGDWGESLASREVIAFHTGGTVRVCWNPPEAGDTGRYNVYRSRASDGRAGTAAAIAYEVSGPCFEDTGVGELTPAPGNLRGAPAPGLGGGGLGEGTHTYRVSAVVDVGGNPYETLAGYEAPIEVTAADVAAGNHSVDLRWNPIPGATYEVYRLDTDGTFLRIATGLTDASLVDDGLPFESPAVSPRAEVESLPPGSLSYWDDTDLPTMNEPREGLDSVIIATDPTDTFTMGIVGRLLVAGGRAQNAAGTYHTSAESLAIFEDGTVDTAWMVEAAEFTSARAFFALLTTQGRNETPVPPPPEEPPCGDLDGDGFLSCDCGGMDCNDADPGVYPGAPEVCGDGIDQDCDMGCSGEDLVCECTDDLDMDGHISLDCGGDDCNDNDPTIHPDAPEICGDGIDQDCDGMDPGCDCDTDADGDGYVSWECGGGDCCDVGTDTSLGCTNDTADGIHPGAMDVCSNGIDEDCDGGEPICRISVSEPYRATAATSLAATTLAAPAPSPKRASPARYAFGSVASSTQPLYALVGDEPVYVVAVAGDDEYAATSNAGRSDIEACLVGDDGHLDCGAQWAVQAGSTQQSGFGIDAVLYFHYLYSLRGVSRETIDPLSRQLNGGNISRFPVTDPATVVDSQVIGGFQSANTSTTVVRGYHETLRLLSYIYVVGGWTDTGSDGLPGPTATVEKHLQ